MSQGFYSIGEANGFPTYQKCIADLMQRHFFYLPFENIGQPSIYNYKKKYPKYLDKILCNYTHMPPRRNTNDFDHHVRIRSCGKKPTIQICFKDSLLIIEKSKYMTFLLNSIFLYWKTCGFIYHENLRYSWR